MGDEFKIPKMIGCWSEQESLVFNVGDQDDTVREARKGNLFGEKGDELSFAFDCSSILEILVDVCDVQGILLGLGIYRLIRYHPSS